MSMGPPHDLSAASAMRRDTSSGDRALASPEVSECIARCIPPARDGSACSTSQRAPSALPDGRDVLVAREDIGGVIPQLEGLQPPIVAPVGGAYLLCPFVAEEVDIDAGAGRGLQCPPTAVHPSHMLPRCTVLPGSHNAHHIGLLPQGKGRLGGIHPAGSPMHMLHQEAGGRRSAASAIGKQHLNGLVTEVLERPRSLVIAATAGCPGIGAGE